MKYFMFIVSFFFLIKAKSQDSLNVELFSIGSGLSLNLKNNSFCLDKLAHMGDIGFSKSIDSGSFHIKGDTILLVGTNKSKIIKFLKQTPEIFIPLNLDSVTPEQKFLAWSIRYANGNLKQNGGWANKNEKDGVWQYYNIDGKLINKKLFKNGKLIDDDFKFSWEK